MNLKFWTWFKKKKTPALLRGRKVKRRQRGLRHGLSKQEWEKINGKEWIRK